MTIRIGFIINPIAGMGGKVGLKGTDGVYEEAVHRGARPIAHERALLCMKEFQKQSSMNKEIEWFTCGTVMGEDVLGTISQKNVHIVYKPSGNRTQSEDTKEACKKFLDYAVDLIMFCGGDGTARDIVSIVESKIPILGIPSGVKMHSAVFGITPAASGMMLHKFTKGALRSGQAEIMDLDEELYRKGIWKVRLYATGKGLIEPTYIQVGKQVFSEVSEDEVKDDLAEHISDEMKQNPDTLFLFGSGGTIEYITSKMGLESTLLGIDAVFKGKTIKKDVNEQQILTLLSKYDQVKVLLSPIGAQGFIIGRGNLQLSPQVLKKIGVENIIVLSTPSKILATPLLRVDSGDASVDQLFFDNEMLMVVIGYRLFRVVHIQKGP